MINISDLLTALEKGYALDGYSDVEFIRGQDQIALYEGKGSGHRYTINEAFSTFGAEILIKAIVENGALVSNSIDASGIIKDRREKLGVTLSDLSKKIAISQEELSKIEDKKYRAKISDIFKVAFYLGLDATRLCTSKSRNVSDNFAIRLKTYSRDAAIPISSSDVIMLSEIGQIVTKQLELQDQLKIEHSIWLKKFDKDSNYGDSSYPAFKHGYYLAGKARELLGYNDSSTPIESIRSLCEENLKIPLIQASLSNKIAGVTMSLDIGEFRGIVINTNGLNENVWVRRATIAHEFGHIFFDPDDNLQILQVDTYAGINEYQYSDKQYVEQRANAFAAEFLAPREGVAAIYNKNNSLEDVMSHFGISHTLARFQLKNSEVHIDDNQAINLEPSDDWENNESFTAAYFPIDEVGIEKRGVFADVVIKAYDKKLISLKTMALYLGVDESLLTKEKLSDIKDIY